MGTKGTQTKELIKEKAYQLFAKKGFCAVTMKDICEESKLSRGGLYRHYGSTQQIFEEILKELSQLDEDFIQANIKEKISAKLILEKLLDKMKYEMLDKKRSLSYAIYEYSYNCDNHFIIELNRKTKEKWYSLIQYGRQRGEFKEVDKEQITDFILYMYQGVRMWSQVIPIENKTVENMIKKIRQDLEE